MIALALAAVLAADAPKSPVGVGSAWVAVLEGRREAPPGTPDAAVPIAPGTVMLPGPPEDVSGLVGMRTLADRIMPSLKESYRLPSLDLRSYQTQLAFPHEVPRIVSGGQPSVDITLMGAGPTLPASAGTVMIYRVRLKDGERVLAEPLVALQPDRRAIVGTRHDDRYVFVVLQGLAPQPPGDIRPMVIQTVRPEFPADAVDIRGKVLVQVHVDAEGNVEDATLLEGISGPRGERLDISDALRKSLNESALKAIRGYKFERPLGSDGKPKEMTVTQSIWFSPPAKPSPRP